MNLLVFQTNQSGTALRADMAVALTTKQLPPDQRGRAAQVSDMTVHREL